MNLKIFNFAKWNSISFLVQTILSLLAVPIYLKQLSDYDFVVISLVWSIASIASVMDFGLSRYITHQLATNLNTNRTKRSYFYVACGFRICSYIAAGATAGVILFMLIYFRSFTHFNDLSFTFILIVATIFFFSIILNFSAAIFDGLHCLKESNIIRMYALLSFTFIPAVILMFKPNIGFIGVVYLMLFARVLVTIYIYLEINKIFKRKIAFFYSKSIAHRFLSNGKWLSLSNISSVVMNQADRFLLASFHAPSKVISYTVPADLIQKGIALLAIIPSALFPIISGNLRERKSDVSLSVKLMLSLVAVGAIVSYFSIGPFLSVWIGSKSNIEMIYVFQLMLLGWAASGFGQIYLSKIHAAGGMKLIGMLHFWELMFFFPIIFFATKLYGPLGAAITWNIRVILDMLILRKLTRKYYDY